MARIREDTYLLNSPSKDRWRRIKTKKRSGVVIPLFSLYSQNSVGSGDFDDLKLFIDWCQKTGNSILQLLPLNETGATFCPYDAISSFALEPVYASLRGISSSKKNSVEARIEQIRAKFPHTQAHVDYSVKNDKMQLLREIFFKEVADEPAALKQFRQENRYWIDDFALYKTLKEFYGGKAWYEWTDEYKNRAQDTLRDFRKTHEREIMFHVWVQWQLNRQFRAVKEYACSKNILIKGDLPILVSRDSADVWAHPEFFKLEFAAGAPPDMYCAKGQRWGMPTYNWQMIAADGYRYVREKFGYAQNFYDIIRIDHVVGLFRIWSIPYKEPMENQGLNGFFDPREERAWGEHGRTILSQMLSDTNMLLCAEDLGTIPKVCTDTLKEFGIPGNDVQRWTKEWKVLHDFLPPEGYRAVSVAMLSTHDTTNWPAWWEYEAGTIDEALFIRKCSGRVEYTSVKDKLFDAALSRYGRLRWLNSVDSVDELVVRMGKKKGELADFIDLYENSFQEKEKLWKHLGLAGSMREKSDNEIIAKALKISLDSSAILCINTIIDWLYLTDAFQGDPYQFRFNTPGTTSPKNWSLVIPFSLERLLQDKVCAEIKKMIKASGRT